MKGDFSRIRFNPRKQYTAVLEQQGRVALDADSNEQAAIYDYLERTETVDVVGEFGAPIHDAGFQITVSNGQILIGAGRYYVEGLICENAAALSYDQQPFLIDPPASAADLLAQLSQAGGQEVLQVFLEVWQRLVTPLDDPCLREPALGQADTTDRIQTVWRVVARVRRTGISKAGCCADMYAQPSPDAPGALSAQTSGAAGDCGCQPIPAAGFRGLENQLYRVEIHHPGDLSTASFKWSRENGCLLAAIQSMSGSTIWVDSLGPDANLGFEPNQWVEIYDDTSLFGLFPNQPGALYQIQSIDPAHRSITMTTAVVPVDPARNARVRRWDQAGASATSAGIALSATTPIPLENGIEVTFSNSGIYKSGDYWTIPARTATGQIEWPPCGGDGAAFQPPQSIRAFAAPLACIHFARSRASRLGTFTVEDCRRFFSPLTELTAPAAAQAMHVTGINWSNDDVMTLDQLVAKGLSVTLDQPPTAPISGANFIVWLEIAVAPPKDSFTTGIALSAAVLPVTILRETIIIDTLITVSGSTLSWQLLFLQQGPAQSATILVLEQALLVGAPFGWFGRVRVRLMGRAIFSSGGSATSKLGAGQIFLDGQSFGSAAVRADGSTPRIDLQLPSGNQEKASDFESWFYLAPTLLLVSITVNHPHLQVIVNAQNVVTGVSDVSGAAPQPVTPQATVTVNYPAVTPTGVSLALSGASGVGNVASIPSTVSVQRNATTAVVPISILSNPGPNVTLTFTITAVLNSAIGPLGAQSVSFSVTGAQPPIIIR